MKKETVVGCGLSSLAIALASTGIASAQEAPQAERGVLELVVVTAQKREEDMQTTPIAVTTLMGSDLATKGIYNPMDLEGQLPGISFQPNSELFVKVRGIGTFNLQPGVDSAVAYSVDGNYVAHPAQLPTLMMDLERVEALRGPQGTLYGRNANAGAINFVTKRPTYDYEVSGSIGYGNYDLFQSEVVANLPVNDKVAIRGAFASRSHDPYLDDGHNDEDQIATRLRALIEPGDRLSVLATVDYLRRDDSNIGVSECPPNAPEAACANVEWKPFDGNDEANPDDYAYYENFGAYVQMDLDVGFATLTYIPTYRASDSAYLTTPTRPFVETVDDNWMRTHELRLASLPSSSIDWVAGLYYSNERMTRDIRYYWDTNPSIPKGPDDLINFFDVDYYKARSKAAFAQVTVPVTDLLRITAGLRYTDEIKISRGSASAYVGDVANPTLVSVPTGDTQEDSRWTWRLGIEKDMFSDSMFYANVSTGFKSGGVSQADPNIDLPTTYGPEKITAYQVGSKNRFLGRRLQLNGELFYYDYEGFQALLPSFQPSGLLYFLTVNSQEAEFYGGELESTFLVTPNDQFDFSLAWIEAEFEEFVVGATDNSGNRPAHTPKYTINLGYERIFDLANGGDVTARVETRFVDDYFVEASNYLGGLQDSYMQSNAFVTYNAPNRNWSLTAWIRNIENNDVIYNLNPPGTRPVTIANPRPPRTFGFTLRASM